MDQLKNRFDAVATVLSELGQAHVLAGWPQLTDGQRRQLLADIEQVDWRQCAALIPEYVRCKPAVALPKTLEPAPTWPAEPTPGNEQRYAEARARGAEAIRAGQVAAFTVAGGQGTRLGYDGPKGAFRASVVRNAPLFQLFAESLLGVARRFGRCPVWYIMTSPQNHDATLAFFQEQGRFGLPPDGVYFFQQGEMPAFFADGRVAMTAPHRLALSPDGHGGSLRALAQSGSLERMRAAGVEYVSYFQVDNPLVRTIDPLFIGLHIQTGSEMSSKAVSKAADTERVGNFCLADGRLTVIEYSDLPEELARARNADGTRRLDAGSIAIHVFNRTFIERLTSGDAASRLPWHRADKVAAMVRPESPFDPPSPTPIVKLEMFVFDALPLARNPLVLFTPRGEEFSPIKNAEGVDSPATSRRDQLRRAARWLEAAGATVPRGPDGEPDALLEIAPKFALDAEDLHARLPSPPRIERGGTLLLM